MVTPSFPQLSFKKAPSPELSTTFFRKDASKCKVLPASFEYIEGAFFTGAEDDPLSPAEQSAQTLSATVIIKADASDSTYERTADASFCKSCLATIAQ